MFKDIKYGLHWPITDKAGTKLKEVSIKTLTVKEHRELFQLETENDELQLKEFIKASAGLSSDQLSLLVVPDFNSIKFEVVNLINSKTIELIDDKDFDMFAPKLLIPIEGDDGQKIKGYKLKPPTVATTALMDLHKDEWDRTMFISQSCTGLSFTELFKLSLPDWNQLQGGLCDFLQKKADFYHQKTSKS